MAVFNRLFWAFVVEALSFVFSLAADAQIVRVRGDQQVCHGTYCTIQSSYGSGTVIAHAGQYKPGKSLVLGCGHQFRGVQFSRLWVQGYPATLLAFEETTDTDLSLIEVDHDFKQALDVADAELDAGVRAWCVGFGGDGKPMELPGTNLDDNSISAQTRVGDSGGPVLSRGNLVCGVLWGQENIGQPSVAPRARYTCVRSIRRFVEKRGYSRYVFRSRSVNAAPSQPPRPVAPAAPPLPTPDPISSTQLDRLEAAIAAMQLQVEQVQLKTGPAGPPGSRGPAGATGSPGVDGADARDPSDAQVSRLVNAWLAAHAADLKGDAGPSGPVGETKLEIRFKGAVVDTLVIPSGKKAVKDLDELLTPE